MHGIGRCGAPFLLAACLCAQNRPFDKKTVLGACRVTGRGSSLHDLMEAASKLGMVARAVRVQDDKTLRSLPISFYKAFVSH